MPNPDMISDQLAFQLAFGHGVLPYPQIPNERVQERRRMLVTEEFNKEFLTAWEACNNAGRMKPGPTRRADEPEALAELADSIADAIYVLLGTAFEYGIPIAAVWRAVQEANMSKLWTGYELNTLKRGAGEANEGWTAKMAPGFEGLPLTVSSRYAVVKDQHGKVRKPPSWKAPDITAIIREAILKHGNDFVMECDNEPPEATPPDQQARRMEWNEAVRREAHQKLSAAADTLEEKFGPSLGITPPDDPDDEYAHPFPPGEAQT